MPSTTIDPGNRLPPYTSALPKIEIMEGGDDTCLTLLITEEDHTFGNAVQVRCLHLGSPDFILSLQHILTQYNEVEFAGYSVPHPLEDRILLRVQTYGGKSTAYELLLRAIDDLEKVFAHIRREATESMERYQQQQDEN